MSRRSQGARRLGSMVGSRESSRATIRELARERLAFERLRPGQEHAVAAAAADRDALAVLPTGGRKSAIHELGGLPRGGPTVVVSPLIALQDDQLAHLKVAGLPATVLNSAQSAGARGACPRHQKPLRDVGPGRGRSRDDPMIRIAGGERRERSEGREAEDCWPPAGGFRGGGYLGSPPLSSSGHALGSRLLITGMR